MPSSTTVYLPSNFDDRPLDEKLQFVESLLDRIEGDEHRDLPPHVEQLLKRRLRTLEEGGHRGAPVEDIEAELLAKYE